MGVRCEDRLTAGGSPPVGLSVSLGPEALIVLVVVLLVIVLLAATGMPPDAALLSGLLVLVIAPVPSNSGVRLGVLTVEQATAGFTNTGLLTVAALFGVVAGLHNTGAIDWIAQSALGRPRSLKRALARMVFPVAAISGFIANTPLVAIMLPAVQDWAKRLQIPPSKLMIPLSYAAVLGGTCSLIGTSTNLVVAGLWNTDPARPALGMFDITWVGLPCSLIGCLVLVFLGPLLLPNRSAATVMLSDPREYVAEMIVPRDSALAGKTIEQAGLRHLPGAYLVEIDRQGESRPAVAPDETLLAGDRLIFAGIVESVRDLQNLRGLQPSTNQVFKLDSPRYRRQLFEAVVSNTCSLVGKTIRDGRFRHRYNAVVLAVARNGERIQGKIGDIELRAGDTLLVEARQTFAVQQRDSRDFFLVSPVHESRPRSRERFPIALAILAGMVITATVGWFDILLCAIIASFLMVVTRCCTLRESRASVDWSVLIVIGCSLGLGRAVEVSGLAAVITDTVSNLRPGRPWLVLAAIYLITALLNEFLANSAAVAIAFPIAVESAARMDVSLMPFIIGIMMAGSNSFATPIGYQTNLMVYGPGGYRFSDYLKLGVPMNLVTGATALVLIPFVFPF